MLLPWSWHYLWDFISHTIEVYLIMYQMYSFSMHTRLQYVLCMATTTYDICPICLFMAISLICIWDCYIYSIYVMMYTELSLYSADDGYFFQLDLHCSTSGTIIRYFGNRVPLWPHILEGICYSMICHTLCIFTSWHSLVPMQTHYTPINQYSLNVSV